MRVLLTTDTLGGVWTFTRELCTELLERHHAVLLISFGRLPTPPQARWVQQTSRNYPDTFRHQLSSIPLEWMPDNTSAYSAAVPLLEKSIDEFSPNLLHFNQFCFGAFPNQLPCLITAHSDVLSWAAACRPEGLEASPWLEQYLRLVRTGLRGAKAVTAPTHWMASQLQAHLPFGPTPEVIPNGRTLLAANEPCPPSVRKLQAVSAGRLWDEAKNTALLQAINTPMPVVVAGEQTLTSTGDRPSEHARATSPATARLTFTGALEEDALHALFRASSVYIATSIYEPFGLAPLEAALCGCAVLANDLPSLREVWDDAAIYFHNAASLERSLSTLAADPAELTAWRKRAHARALHYPAGRMAEAYLALYADLIGRCHSSEAPLPPASHAQERSDRAV